MAIRTDIATHYLWRNIIIAVICVVLSLWGAYDFFVKIPAQQENFEAYRDTTERIATLQSTVDNGGLLSPDERAELQRLDEAIEGLDPPEPPSTFDHLVQIMYMSLILSVPWSIFVIMRTRSRQYELDDEGNLNLPDGAKWSAASITGI